MQAEYKIYNLDHGFKKETKINIGEYEIFVSDFQAKNLNSLETNAKRSFEMDETFNRIVKEYEYQPGGIFETATIKIDEKQITRSLIYTELPERNSVDDFILFLSFITGRRVYLDRDLNRFISTFYTDGAVNKHFFHFPAVDLSHGFQSLSKLQITTQFYNLVHVKTLRDLSAMCFYSNTIINGLYENWCKANNTSKYPKPKVRIDNIKNFLKLKIESSLVSKFKVWVHSYLSEDSYDKHVKSDIVERINLYNGPSALYKFQKFLTGIGILPENPDKDMIDRLKWINRLRNTMVHMGELPSDKHLDLKMRAEISSNITFLLIDIAEFYFANEVFKIDNFLIEQNKNDIINFFKSGIFRGKKVFNETYEDFCNRQDYEWIENGNYV